MSSSRVVFKHNNHNGEDIERYLAMWPEIVKYIICGEEVAPTTGTNHIQGYAVLLKKIRFKAMRELFPGCHIEVAKVSFKHHPIDRKIRARSYFFSVFQRQVHQVLQERQQVS